ncbi:MAG: alpha/beta hydrolase [Sinobacterium sp.]|nr:alpha/beta hydrolase [Sinobacterium sp.]
MTEKIAQPTQTNIEFNVRGIVLHAIEYKAASPKATIITLHGWLDNAASFHYVAPALAEQGFTVIALDLAGQGLSDMRPLQGTYHLWDDAVDVINIADQLNLSTFYLMGHSRGAMIATQITAAFPERVKKLCVLDGLLPIPVEMDETVEQFQNFVKGFQKKRESRVFATRDLAIQIRAKAANMQESAVELLASRGLFQLEGETQGWQWAVDERLKAASAVKMTQAHNEYWIAALVKAEVPTQVILAEKGLAQLPEFKGYQQQYPQIQWLILAGGHHQHMQDEAGEIVRHCVEFFTTATKQ